ncbi:MAG: LapA family protein [Bacteroidota bacterium]|nr:LapA family protein [Bacteroidota bacterium]
MKKIISIILALIILLLVVIVTLNNSNEIIFGFLGKEYETSMAVLIILTLGVGVIIGLILFLPEIINSKNTKRKISKLESTIENLKSTNKMLEESKEGIDENEDE